MAFDVMDIDLSQLFKNDDTYTIPRYQRNYVWNRTNWMQLIGDIDFCAETTPDWSHFVGSMVFERKKKSIGLNEPGVKNKKDGEMCAGQAVEKIKSRF